MGSSSSKPKPISRAVQKPFVDPECKYPFKNLVFEGGGAKGGVYIGVLQALQDAKILSQIERVAGSSAGAMTAMLVCFGANATDVQNLFNETDMKKVIFDGHYGDFTAGNCKICCTMWNCKRSNLFSLVEHFGMFPGEQLREFLEDVVEQYTGKRLFTFMDAYIRYGRELCVTASNLSTSSVEYFHPKTFPDFPIAHAVHMSMSLPMVIATTKMKLHGNATRENIFTDGGFFNNYPVQAFDGWTLSMKPEDSFLNRWASMLEKANQDPEKAMVFGLHNVVEQNSPNPLTLGFKIFCSGTQDLDAAQAWLVGNPELVKEIQSLPLSVPRTKLGGAYLTQQNVASLYRIKVQQSFNKVQEHLKKLMQYQEGGKISKAVVTKHSPELADLFDKLDVDKNGSLNWDEFESGMERHGFPFEELFRGSVSRPINSLPEFITEGIIDSLQNIITWYQYSEADIQRTCPIDTTYIKTTDFDLEKDDKEYMSQSGKLYTQCYLKTWLEKSKK